MIAREHCFFDRSQARQVQRLLPGAYTAKKSGDSAAEMIMTVLGSCVAVCLTDKAQGIAGMNHFMLPNQLDPKAFTNAKLDPTSSTARYGVHAMELLVNQMLKLGSTREHLRAWVFGGAKVLPSISDIGLGNVQFALKYLKCEGITLVAQDTGGFHPRKLYLDAAVCIPACFPVPSSFNVIQNKEAVYAKRLGRMDNTGSADISIFDWHSAQDGSVVPVGPQAGRAPK